MSLLQIHEPGQTPAPHEDAAAIGIDLGTTHSVAALWHQGAPVAIENGDGISLIPSVVRYGEEVISSIKRLMGRSAEEAKTLAPHLAKYLVPSAEGSAAEVPRLQTPEGVKTPVELSAEILKTLRRMAEEALGKEVRQAVITVPAYFDDAARLATKDAARLAGLEVLRLLNEPTAAALAYGLERGAEGIYAIYDLGGGTFDISLLRLEGGVFQVLATAGDTALGGDDLDHLIAAMLPNPHAAASLRAARRAKEQLSEVASTTIDLEGTHIALTREMLHELSTPLVERTLNICAQALEDAGINKEDLKGVVLVGGSTRLRDVRSAVASFFGQAPLTDLDPDRVVAFGAAIQAHQLVAGGEHLLLDVVPLSLGLETMGDLVEKLIYRNTPIPTAVSQEFTTYQDGQTGMMIHVVQGERELASQCRSLARFELTGIPPMAAGLARIRVTFQVDADGLLTVTAQETTTGTEQHVEVQPSYGLKLEEMERMLRESMEHARADISARLLAETKVEARRLLRDLAAALEQDRDLLTEAEAARIARVSGQLEASLHHDDRDLIDIRQIELQHLIAPFAQKRMDKAIGEALKGSHIEEL